MPTIPRRHLLIATLALATWAQPALAQSQLAGDALLASPLRTDDDRKADAGRKPQELLRFAQVTPGMTVLDIVTGGGYTAQLLALAVGATGKVYAQGRTTAAIDKRLAAHPQGNLVGLARPLEDLFPPDLPRVDLATLILNYHDIANSPVDRDKMNRAIYAALKPGGKFVLVDHAAKPGTGLAETKTLHRIDEATVRSEVQAAGFVLEAEGEFLRNPKDPHEQIFSELQMPADRFALRFVRPAMQR